MNARALAVLATPWLLACAGSGSSAAGAAAGAPDAAPPAWEAARLRGVVFRGLGNEPGWSVEIGPDERIVIQTDYGRTRVELLLGAAPLAAPAARTTLSPRSGPRA